MSRPSTIWPFSVLGRIPQGMLLEEARRAGLAPPEGFSRPPPPRLADALRTGATALRLLAPLAKVIAQPRRALAVTSTTEAGLAMIRNACLATLARLGVTLEVRDADNVVTGGLVIMWNQTSHLDHLVLPAAIPRPFHSLYNNELRATPLYGRYLEKSGHFWVDRTDEAQWRAHVGEAADRVRAGACVLVSPEGTRSWDGRLLPMKRGAFLLARQSGRPIVCATVIGAHDRLPRGCTVVRAGPVRVVFSAPIPTDDHAPLEAQVAATFERILASSMGPASGP
jgi:1-acyl-sn-glycerol-3-phosphate acyltransferase